MSKTEIYDEKTGTKRYWISNKNGMQAAFLERGATMTTLTSPDKENKYENTIIELKDFNEYLNNTPYMAVVPGRYANRIAKGKFTIDGIRKAPAGEVSFEETFELDINNLLKLPSVSFSIECSKSLLYFSLYLIFI